MPRGHIAWILYSPDTSLGIFLQGYVKHYLYQTPIHDVVTLHGRISEAVHTVDVDMLQREWREV